MPSAADLATPATLSVIVSKLSFISLKSDSPDFSTSANNTLCVAPFVVPLAEAPRGCVFFVIRFLAMSSFLAKSYYELD